MGADEAETSARHRSWVAAEGNTGQRPLCIPAEQEDQFSDRFLRPTTARDAAALPYEVRVGVLGLSGPFASGGLGSEAQSPATI